MLTADDITSRCPASQRPYYVVFRRLAGHETGTPFWHVGSMANDQSEALFKANLKPVYPNPAHDCFVLETTFSEADNLLHSGARFAF